MKAFIFDLDGTLVDSVYPHTLAWQRALSPFGMPCPAWALPGAVELLASLAESKIAHGIAAPGKLRDRGLLEGLSLSSSAVVVDAGSGPRLDRSVEVPGMSGFPLRDPPHSASGALRLP